MPRVNMITIWNRTNINSLLVCGARSRRRRRRTVRGNSEIESQNFLAPIHPRPAPTISAERKQEMGRFAIKYERIYYYITAFTFYVTAGEYAVAPPLPVAVQCSINKTKKKKTASDCTRRVYLFLWNKKSKRLGRIGRAASPVSIL
ncbi:hypothetical protein EVAR_100399_1 [Eumeta japonica]|uniref:Uncharacterized protein n=1 Tax=Eumeta variegata TaxID=151549 RepID=A0A4C2AI62_EUMVA|nr:hypothetical protein EVAR_100399_1 [Eumeta japonica]